MVKWADMEWAVTIWGGEHTSSVEDLDDVPILKAELFDGTPLDICIDSGTITRTIDNGWVETDTVQFIVIAERPPSILVRDLIFRLVAWQGDVRLGDWGLYRITNVPEIYEDSSLALEPRFTYVAEDWLALPMRWTIMTTNTARMTVDHTLNILENVVKRARSCEGQPGTSGATADYWEGVAYLCLWDITNGQIAPIEAVNFTPLPPSDPHDTRNQSPLRGLHFDEDTRWVDILGQLFNPDVLQRAGWSWEGCTVAYDKLGQLHLRTARRRWTRNWGYSQDPDHFLGTEVHIINYTARRQIPAADVVEIVAPSTSPPNWVQSNQPPGTKKPYWPPAVLGRSMGNTHWYTVTGNPRTLRIPLLSPALIYNYSNNGDYTYLTANAQQAAEAAMKAILRDAYQIDISFVPTGLYFDLTQDIDFIKRPPHNEGDPDPSPADDIIRATFAVTHTTTNMLPMYQTVTGQWSADL